MFTILFSLFLVSFVQDATSIRCFECTSANNTMCVDPKLYDEETLRRYLPDRDCKQGVQAIDPHGGDFFCRKIQQTILHKNHDPEVRITRSCGWVRHKNPCYKVNLYEDHVEMVCQCFSDYCNAASGVENPRLFIILFAVTAILRIVFWTFSSLA